MDGGAAASSPAGSCGDGGPAEWLRIYNRMVAMLRKGQKQIESLVADRDHLEAFVKIQHDFWVARDGYLQERIQMMRKQEVNRKRVEAAESQLLLGDKDRDLRCFKNYAELTDNDLEDFKTCATALAAENNELKIKLKEVESRSELSKSTADHEHSKRYSREELRELKKAYKSLCSENNEKDKKISSLVAERDFVWNQLKTMEKDHTQLLKIKKIEAMQATEAAQKLHQNVEELQVAAQKKDEEIGRWRAEAVDAKKKILILEDKLQEMHLAKEKDNKIEKCNSGQPETSQKRKKDMKGGHRKSRSEGPALRGKSKSNSRRKIVEDWQPQTSHKRKCGSSLTNGLVRCSSRLQVKAPAVQLFSPSFKVPKVKAPTPS